MIFLVNKSSFLSNLPQVWKLVRSSHYPIKLVWIGLDNVGKSSLIKRLKTGEFYDGNMPRTMGLSVDKLFYEADSNFEILSWDLGGQIYFRENLWNDYLKGASAIIYVFDISENDENRFVEARKELWEYVLAPKNELHNAPVLILANKSDKSEVMDERELVKKLDIEKVNNRNLALYQVSALSGFNLEKAFIWLFKELLAQNEKKKKH